MRATCVVVVLFGCAAARAADLPKDITPEARAAFLERIKPDYTKSVAEWKGKAEDAKVLAKFKATEKEGKQKLAVAESRLALLDKDPWRVDAAKLTVIGERPFKPGDFAVVSSQGQFQATAAEGGALVEGVVDTGDKKIVVRFLIASPFGIPKQLKGKKDPPLKLPGLWYVAGVATVKGNEVPVIYQFELSKDERESLKK